MAKAKAARHSAKESQSKGNDQAQEQTSVQEQPTETQQAMARTGGSDRPATMAEDREARANQQSGHGMTLGRSAAMQGKQPKLTAEQAAAAKKGTPREKQAEPQMGVTGQLDHAALNHTREKAPNQGLRSEIGGLRTEARGSTPWPQDITQMDERTSMEAIRTTDKADVLVKWLKDERAADEPRQSVVDVIYQKLLHVQGPPLPLEYS